MSITTSVLNVASRTFNEGFSPMLRELFSLPGERRSYIWAKLLFSTILSTVQAGVFLFVGLLFMGMTVNPKDVLLVLISLLLISFAISTIFITIAVTIKDMGRYIIVSNVLSQVAIWGSTIFAPLSSAPKILRVVMYLNPLSYGTDLIRNILIFSENQHGLSTILSWTLLGLIGIIFGVLSIRLLSARAGKAV